MSRISIVPERAIEPPEDKIYCTCPLCGESVYWGDLAFELGGDLYHKDCFELNAVKLLVEDYGARLRLAED